MDTKVMFLTTDPYPSTAFSKVFEKAIYVRLYQHLANNNILIDEQLGFRHKSSTTAAAYNLIN